MKPRIYLKDCFSIRPSFKKGLFLVFIFFTFTPLTLIIMLSSLYHSNRPGDVLGTKIAPVSESQLYAALPDYAGEISIAAKVSDGRCLTIENYLKKYKSPLLAYADLICSTSEKYGLDHRLLVAIAQQESNLCKTSHPEWFNCWGWGIHSRGTKTYTSFEEAIESVAKGIKENYCDKGLCDDPCLMMKKYTPKSNGSWCFGVNKFMEEMNEGFSS
ncbi:MAG: hypothetical protein BWY24_00658 [Microgenomates group bacterium ADurb.Bin219]|nr:MAG: hypothetical protein BWY24_00658 [Microgenomates group bacterium ADurb.Bin219]